MSRRRVRERGRVGAAEPRARSAHTTRAPISAVKLALLALVGAALVGLLAGGAVLLGSSRSQPAAARPSAPSTPFARPAQVGEEVIPVLASPHVAEGTRVAGYNSNPPTSGPHWPQPAAWGVYGDPLPDEQLVHNLEHGGVWISYRPDIDAATRAKLEAFARAYPQAIVLAPRAGNDKPIVLASWGRLQRMHAFDDQRMIAFVSANLNKSPEKLANLEQPALKVGEVFPDFVATEVDGRRVTRDTLQGKPAIVWFTTTYCVPCQIGARVVAKLDDELGGNAFQVLVLFVDPREQPADLRSWRRQFAREDWMLALDVELAKRVELRYLDTKYLLDRGGVIRNVDVAIADDRYLQRIREVVQK